MINKNNAVSAVVIIVSILNFYCGNRSLSTSSSSIYGKYKIYSNDPEMQRFTQGENTYLEIKNDQPIVYYSTINNKLKFNFTGNFIFDKTSNTMNIKWNEGKLPSSLKIENGDGGHIIRIGETQYKKETR